MALEKFGRNYIVQIQKRSGGGTLDIRPPFTIEFDIHRNSFSSANVGSIRIYNLNRNNREQIRHDQFDYDDQRDVSLMAGYGDNLALAFKGRMSQAWSTREGNSMVTQIECFDGGFAYLNAITDAPYPAGTSTNTIIDALIASLPGITRGAVSKFDGSLPRGNALNGSTIELLNTQAHGSFFIDSGKAHCIKDTECIQTDVPVLSAQTGLLGTPIREQQLVTVDMLFQPNLVVGQAVLLLSETAENFNGECKIIGLKHRGTISGAVAGPAVTSLMMLPGVFTRVSQGPSQ